ncbi:tetratricopeptide repeat protein 28-like isoform X2 [Limulus polyphemus]|uniref:Tetratricopeptide repeat protein 28-like isoform X2 n=1 Tax=Limulus polyphemus TaxID=6850 RepID=A0ABM1SJC4_LIMPO|nr:tetratricopeptide repeat protein 28-like isoform X2 [Limulus polyphemus]
MEVLQQKRFDKIRENAASILYCTEQKINQLKECDISEVEQQITMNKESFTQILANFSEKNVPAAARLTDKLLEKENDEIMRLYLIHNRQILAMNFEGVEVAREFAEKEYKVAKEMYKSLKKDEDVVYVPLFEACMGAWSVCRWDEDFKQAEDYLLEGKAIAENDGNRDRQQLAQMLYLGWKRLQNSQDIELEKISIVAGQTYDLKDVDYTKHQFLGNFYASYCELGLSKEHFQQTESIDESLKKSGFLNMIYNLEGRSYEVQNHCIVMLSQAFEKALGLLNEAESILTEALSACRQVSDKTTESMVIGALGTTYRKLGLYDKAICYHTQRLQHCQNVNHLRGISTYLSELALDFWTANDLDQVEIKLKQAIMYQELMRSKLGQEDVSRVANFDFNQRGSYNFMQSVLVKHGKIKSALAVSELARGRALANLIMRNVKESESGTESWLYDDSKICSTQLGDSLMEEILKDFYLTADEMDSTILVYTMAPELNQNGLLEPWLYIWVVKSKDYLQPGEDRVAFRRVSCSNVLIPNKTSEKDDPLSKLSRSFGQMTLKEELLNKDHDEAHGAPINSSLSSKRSENCSKSVIEKSTLYQILCDLELVQAVNRTFPDVSEEEEQKKRGQENSKINKMERITISEEEKSKVKETLQYYYHMCIGEIADVLPQPRSECDIPRLIIIPHSNLFSIPFSLLLSPEEKYLVEDYIISYSPSLKILRLLQSRLNILRNKQGSAELKVTAFGNPKMAPKHELKELEHGEAELQMVQQIFGTNHCTVVNQNAATKEEFINSLQACNILHVVSHATVEDPYKEGFGDDRGDYSVQGCLVMAPSDITPDGLVHSRDLQNLDCICQLIVLSCCMTALGKPSGDGVLGLYRSLLAGGATGVLGTLWKIRDDTTPLLMEKFYKYFVEDEDAPKAMRLAMISFMKEGFYSKEWGAFVFVGVSGFKTQIQST